ncbi:unnamed protein product [Strongylus vulgaris]|uniref:Uncharacterized protein n=1 Tax=Strongylus vulgaris TaxID=40348 RepID=A0A3P7KT61_STRVU|nr:unnamed protein product [Strongylus vulgaris]
MKLCEMILVKDAAYHCIGEIGKYGNVQFNDVSSDPYFENTHELNYDFCNFLPYQIVFSDPEIDS